MRILITGATGFIGQHLARALLESGHEISVLTRDVSTLQKRFPYVCRSHLWNGKDAIGAEALEGVDAVVHLAGESVAKGRWTEAKKKEILESRVAGTRAIVNAMKRDARPTVLVAASAIGYYGEAGDQNITEDSNPGQDFLSQVCQQWEAEALQPRSAECRVVILRLGIVLGREGGALPQMLPPFRAGIAGRLGSGRQWMSWIHIHDLTSLIITAVREPTWVSTYNATAPTPVRNSEFTKTLAATLHRPAFLPLPAFAVRALIGAFSQELLASKKVLPCAAQREGFHFKFPNLAEALSDLC